MIASAGPDLALTPGDLTALPALSPAEAKAHRQERILDGWKWDPQVGDRATVAPLAWRLQRSAWQRLAVASEALDVELNACVNAVLARPELIRHLGLPTTLSDCLVRHAGHAGRLPAITCRRYDWHPTTMGWRISEVNADVPGGFNEAGSLSNAMAARYGLTTAGDPGIALATAIAQRCPQGSAVALAHCTSYSDDRQVMEGLAACLAHCGLRGVPCAMDHLDWTNGGCRFACSHDSGTVAALIRFYPAEWLPELDTHCRWRRMAADAHTQYCNPLVGVIAQSKRLSVLWPALNLVLPTWQQALPPTRDPRDAPWRERATWLLKPTLGRVGEQINWLGRSAPIRWRRQRLAVALAPHDWVAQRRFQVLALSSDCGPQRLCLGIYVINGQACGIYARQSADLIIDAGAAETAVLVED